MKSSINVKNVKCTLCKKKIKTNKINPWEYAENCNNEYCALRSEGYRNVMSFFKKPTSVPPEETFEIEVEDPIVIEIDPRGHERSLP